MYNETRSKSSVVSDEVFERRLRELEKPEYNIKGATDDDMENDSKNKSKSTDSWMDLYRPKNYLDLLSEENVNRTLLHWLKLWDKAVFNREVKIKVPKIDENIKPKWAQGQKNTGPQGRFDKKFEHKKKFFNKNTDGELKEELDSSGRPIQKIVLISGPPGLGKTTLAHVVAKHSGYYPVEMNASDDRNVEAFKLQIEAATQMRSVMGANPLPNCLIIDEIDGAPAASINFLVNTLTQDSGQNKENSQATKKKKKKGINIVSRPVICICNDLYTPSLRPLRQAALVLQFPPTNPNRLAQRLLSISKEHDIQVDMTTMLALCEKADYDIRSCLATLYFLKSRRRPLRYSDVMNLNIGHKDNHKSLFQVWQEIFHIPRQKRSQYMVENEREGMLPLAPDVDRPLAPNAGNNASMPARFANILHAVHSCGEYDRLMQGVFENYPNIKFKDSYLNAVCIGLDWMCFFDHVNHFIQLNQNYCVFGYLPYAFIALHFQMAAVLSQKIQYPTAQTELRAKQGKNENIVSAMLQDLKPTVRITNNKDIIIQDIIPFSLPIITPSLRPVSAQLYSAEEKEQILRVIGVMISYNLTFRQEKTIDGVYRYCLEPDVEQVAYFEVDNVQRKSLTYSVKQMLAREIELEKLRQYECNLGPMITPKATIEEIEEEPKVIKPPPNAAMTLALKPKPIVESCKPATDFFGRPLKTPPKKKNADGSSVQIAQNDVWYHFKEGYSNAVRRSVKMADFI
ncbi:chromosome transmission fidelity protein 18 homolog [Daphnia pulicaria]|uniref:chromosome transmission fidelity protein 18 homolog n=1 Tax=Daphnia pulicaria TaxID=35523 RepID=UPI001EECAFA5|nr:chromosome transmission fidelity protein 18 homolog [Daphnia pulicaria]